MSMIKYQNLPAYDAHGNKTVVAVNRSDMTKTAGYDNFGQGMREFLASLNPEEGYAFLLVAAMGDQNWGPNRNGDYWPTEALKNDTSEYGYKTYMDGGHWYHHHQNKDPNAVYGDVIYSTWNDMMGRIELVVKVDLRKDEKTRVALENGATIETSMGARVKWDACKVCHPNWKEFYKIPDEEMVIISKENNLDHIHEIGRKYGVDLSYITKLNPNGGPVGIHSNIDKYCHHMLTMKNQVLPSGEWVCVVNFRPRLFDISFVGVNADKSSFVLSKVAEEGDNIKEYPNEDEPEQEQGKVATVKSADQIESPGDSEIDKKVEGGQVLTDDLDEIEKYYVNNICPTMHRYEPEIPDEVMDNMANTYALPEILSSFLAMGMYPHPREFQRVVMIQLGKKDELREADSAGDYLRMSDIPPLTSDPGVNMPLGIGEESINHDLMEQLRNFFWERSSYRQPLVKRMVIIKKAGWLGNGYIDPAKEAPKNRNIAPALLGSLGTLYALSALEGRAKLGDIVNAVSHPGSTGWIGAKLGLAIAGAMLAHKAFGGIVDNRQKGGKYEEKNAADLTTKKLLKYIGPTLGTYLLGGYVINKAQRGKPISKPEEFVAKHPMITSAASTVLVNNPKGIIPAGKSIAKGIQGVFKRAEMGIDMSQFNVDDLPPEERDLGGIAVWEIVNGMR